jgi:thiol-disulfide isomerase/thioredoxin
VRRWFALLAVSVAFACSGPPAGELVIGGQAPSFAVSSIDGSKVHLEDLAGQKRVLVFWATWCRPCLAEIPALEAIEKESPGRIVSIVLDEGGETDVQRFLDQRPLPYQVLLGDAALFASYDGLSIPHTVILDSDLSVVAVHRGSVGEQTIRRDLEGERSNG